MSNVTVNLLYLDKGPMTQFLFPAAIAEEVHQLQAPDDLFAPFGVLVSDEKAEEGTHTPPIVSEKWCEFLANK